jgi:hypothetical protein
MAVAGVGQLRSDQGLRGDSRRRNRIFSSYINGLCHAFESRDANEPPNLQIGEEEQAKDAREDRSEIRNDVYTLTSRSRTAVTFDRRITRP